MSDTKATNLTSLVSKKTRRAKARLLQNFGKADKTTDELFEVYQQNFNRQQSTALNLQKQVRHYLHCLKELHEASRGLSQCLLDMHEKDWPKHDLYENNSYELDHINEDLEEKLKESVLVPLEQYLGQFAEMREKIAKRGRKLVDYDSQRHKYEASLQNQAGKPIDDLKLSKARDQLEEAKQIYEALNTDLHEELPALYENRLPFIITVFQRLFSSKLTYYQENIAVQKSYLETIEPLAKATEKGNLSGITSNNISHQQMGKQQLTTTTVTNSTTVITNQEKQVKNLLKTQDLNENSSNNSKISDGPGKASDSVATVSDGSNNKTNEPDNKPPNVLYRVCATYKYLAEDEDELSFEAGEIIQVVDYDDPEEQEEGWSMGIKESTGQKGLFPANFTKRI